MESAAQTSNSNDRLQTTAAAPHTAAAPGAPAVIVPATDDAPAKRKRRPFLILGIIAVIAGATIGVYTFLTAGRENTDDAQIAADVVPIATRVGGAVVRVHIKENQLVKRGDLLIEIDPNDYEARVQQAEAELATAKAQAAGAQAQVEIVDATSKGGLASAKAALSGSNAGVQSAGAQIAASHAEAARADAELKKAQIDLDRARALRQANAVPQERLDSAQIGFDAAQAAKAQADAQVSLAEDARRSAESRVGEARGKVSQSAPIAPQIAAARANADLANARVRSADASLALARLQLGYTKISAPADGFASKLTVHEGQLVATGQPLIQLVPNASYLVANFKETQVGQMHVGQPAEIKIDALPGRSFEGKIESLSGGTGASFSLLPADNATGNFVKVVQRVPVRVAWVNPPGDVDLRAGLSADVTVDVRK
ncbi:MAG TPA: HlyD family secretion protein [Polyangia bacterium]|nr:HlyD family secretion protein [Polyangia bacterium]